MHYYMTSNFENWSVMLLHSQALQVLEITGYMNLGLPDQQFLVATKYQIMIISDLLSSYKV